MECRLTSATSGTAGVRTLDRVYFYTSSTDKFLQARRVFDKRGLIVDYFRSRTEPYDEDYGGSSQDLLEKSLTAVTKQIGRGHLLFIEDTSVRIEALSSSERDVPGLEVKDWFAQTSFAECDAAIEAAGGNRRATVKSDIALSIPGLARPVFFHGETTGWIAENAPDFAQNVQSPWLSPSTFNGWFVPDGQASPLGSLDAGVAESLDFRGRAFAALIDRIEEYVAVLNLPSSAYRVRKPMRQVAQPSLFDNDGPEPPALLIIGRTCAGKTTMSEHLSERYGVRMIEASSIVRSLPVAADESDDPGGYAFADRALTQLGYDIVPRKIVERFGSDLEKAFVVSGLRDPSEILAMRLAIPRCVVVLVEASERARFDRHLRRGRPGAERTLPEFRQRDLRQNSFGLLPVGEDLADYRILNDGTMDYFHEQIGDLLHSLEGDSGLPASSPRHGPGENQLFRCLAMLEAEGGALQCDEIESLSVARGGSRIRHNNANKVMRAVPALATRIDSKGGAESSRVRYKLSERGSAYLRLLEQRPGYAGVDIV